MCQPLHQHYTNCYDLHILNIIGAGVDAEYIPEWTRLNHSRKHSYKFAATKHMYTVQCTNHDEMRPTAENIETLFTSLLDGLTADIDQTHYVGFSLQSPSLDYPISLPLTRLRNFDANTMFTAIKKTLNSNEDFRIDGRLRVDMAHVEVPEGMGLDNDKDSGKF